VRHERGVRVEKSCAVSCSTRTDGKESQREMVRRPAAQGRRYIRNARNKLYKRAIITGCGGTRASTRLRLHRESCLEYINCIKI
jgi:hypothetical protein